MNKRSFENSVYRIELDYNYVGKVTKFRFDFKNRILGFRWHVIAVRTLHYERFLTANWLDDGQELDYIYLTDEEYFHLTITNDLAVFDNQLNLASFDSLSEQVI